MGKRIIALPTVALRPYYPNDENRRPTTDEVVYTLENPHAFGGHVPAYEDPAHLAAWVYGFATANDLAIDANTAKEGN